MCRRPVSLLPVELVGALTVLRIGCAILGLFAKLLLDVFIHSTPLSLHGVIPSLDAVFFDFAVRCSQLPQYLNAAGYLPASLPVNVAAKCLLPFTNFQLRHRGWPM